MTNRSHACQWALTCLASLLLFACKGSPPAATGDAPAVTTTAAAATDWCAEHGVPESQCTRCNPKLIADFKEKGDWCAEHGLPESQCTLCNPDLVEKFARMSPNTQPEAYAGLRVRLAAPETASKAGIEFERVEERIVDASMDAPVMLAFDETRSSRISSPMTGVVREVRVTPGTRVRPGMPVVVVACSEVPEVAGRLRDAEAALILADQNVDRERRLVAEDISTRKTLEEALREQAAARAGVQAARESLASLGVSAGPSDASGRLSLRAPREGVVTRVNAAVGQAVIPENVLVEINDPTRLWAELDIPERDAAAVHERDEITMTFGALPNETTKGTISWISPEVDPRTRTVRARAEVPNPNGRLRAGMFGRARVVGVTHRSLVVPTDAVQLGPEGPLVFVRLAPQDYRPRGVRIGRATADRIEVVAGLNRGEEVVTQGSFLLKTEIMKGSLGAGCCNVVEK